MRKFVKSAVRSQITWSFLAVTAVFWLTWFFTSDEFSLVFASSLMFAAVTVMASVFIWVVLNIIRRNKPDRVDWAIVTMAGVMSGELFMSGWRSSYLAQGRPEGMFQHPAFSYAIYMVATSLFCMIYVWWSDPEIPVSRGRFLIAIALAISISVCMITWWLGLFRFLPFEMM